MALKKIPTVTAVQIAISVGMMFFMESPVLGIALGILAALWYRSDCIKHQQEQELIAVLEERL